MQKTLNDDEKIILAHKVASYLEKNGLNVETGGLVLAMALGILAAAHPNGHRNLHPLILAQVTAAQAAFDSLKGLKSKPVS